MRKIPAQALTEIADYITDVRQAIADFDKARNEFSAVYDDALSSLNNMRSELYGIMETQQNNAQEYYEERSEKWQESDAGEAYQEWVNRLESIVNELDDELDTNDIPEIEEPDWVASLEDSSEWEAPEQ